MRKVDKAKRAERVQQRGEAAADRAPARAQAAPALRRPAPARRDRAARWRASRGCILFDEPLSNLDAQLRLDMRTEIKKLHQRLGATIVYVTHDQIEAMTLATRIAVMKGGVLQQLGTPSEVYNRPANTFVAGFMGSPRMNLLPARLAGSEGGSSRWRSRRRARRPCASTLPAARRTARLHRPGGHRRHSRRGGQPGDATARRRRPTQRVDRGARRGDRADRRRHAGGPRPRRPRVHRAAASPTPR